MCMQVLMAKHNQILSSALNMLCKHLGTTTGQHPQQLSLEDFLAIKANEMNTHLDFQNIARKKPLQIQKQQRIEGGVQPKANNNPQNHKEDNQVGGGWEQKVRSVCRGMTWWHSFVDAKWFVFREWKIVAVK